jgi:gamma-glutamyltranspeptidase/glutathione hydrolase
MSRLLVTLVGCLLAVGPAAAPVAARQGVSVGIVAASHPLAAEAGAEMLRRGGNAIDAMAAVQFALNVVEPQFSGIGGGGFLMLYLPDVRSEPIVLDGREAAPAAATADQFLGPDGRPRAFAEAHQQGTAVGVPGTLRNVETALRRFGTLPLSETLQPAIDLAENGFAVNRFLAADIAASQAKLASWPASAAVFLPAGRPLAAGERLRQADLARTLRLIGDEGSDVLYHGEVGQALIAAQAQRGGRMTLDDLAAYEVKERAPVSGAYRGYRVFSMPPPSSGGLTMLQILMLLEPFDLRQTGVNTPESLHLLLEATRLAYADRGRYLGDADLVPVPIHGLINPAYISQRRGLIDRTRANPSPAPGDPWAFEPDARPLVSSAISEDGPHTTHVTIVDAQGNLVAYTTTIEQAWGTGMLVPGYGFLLNNELTDFDFVPGGPNEVAPGKRPRSSMSPTMLFDDRGPYLALGSPGGATIITTVTEVLLNVLEHGLGLQEAIDAPRVASSSFPSFTWEAGVGPSTLEALRTFGHRPAAEPTSIGSVQAALRTPDGSWIGAADRRRAGTVVVVSPAAGGGQSTP